LNFIPVFEKRFYIKKYKEALPLTTRYEILHDR